MANPNKALGSKGEREAAALLTALLGKEVKRRHNLGTHDDVGDLYGVDDLCVQVYAGVQNVVAVGLVKKPLDVDLQAANMGAEYAMTMVRIRGGKFRIVLTPEQWLHLYTKAHE